MPTYVDGIGSSQAIDTAGEIVDINGLDCSSLIGSAFNFEHKSDLPAQIVGKILKYKKIFSDTDCEDDRQKMYWEKLKMPFLYVMGRLFDDKQDSAKQLAALFIDDAEHPNEQPMIGFSVEGAKIHKEGMIITKSIARKITCTAVPANKTCVAQMIPADSTKPTDDIDEIFKNENFVEIELFKSHKIDKAIIGTGAVGGSSAGQLMDYSGDPSGDRMGSGPTSKTKDIAKSQVPGSKYPPAAQAKPSTKGTGTPKFAPIAPSAKDPGKHIGTTTGGTKVHSHMGAGDYPKASSKEHQEMGEIHRQASSSAPSAAERSHHHDKYQLHSQASNTAKMKEGRFATAQSQKRQKATNFLAQEKKNLGKSLTAGSAMGAPSTLEGGAALGKENLDSKKQNVSVKKSKWLARAEEEYGKWNKKEEFRKFMSEKLPKLTRGEIDAIGQTLMLGKSIKMLKAVSRLNSAYRDDSSALESYVPNIAKSIPVKGIIADKIKKEKKENKISSVPSQVWNPVLTMSEKMGKFDDAVLNAPMANKEQPIDKGSDAMMASEKTNKK